MISRKEIYGIVLVLVAAILFHAYVGSVRDTAKADQVRQDVQTQLNTLRTDLGEKLAAIAEDKKNVKTPAQVAVAVPRYVEGVKPIVIVPGGVPTNTSDYDGNVPSISLPDAPSAISVGSLVIPREQVPAYWKSVTSCAEDHANLEYCSKQVPLLEQERDAWKKASKGTFWGKTKTALKWTAIGIGIGAGVAYATH